MIGGEVRCDMSPAMADPLWLTHWALRNRVVILAGGSTRAEMGEPSALWDCRNCVPILSMDSYCLLLAT